MERWVNALGEDIEDPDLVVDIDTAFHAAVAKATLNPVAVQLVTALNNEARGDRQTTYRNPGAIDVARTGHIQILAAIKAGDKAAARRAMERHLKEAKLFIHPKDPGP
jgi:GntR family transcriptional repressor for pyruvate dehydrogenase complex